MGAVRTWLIFGMARWSDNVSIEVSAAGLALHQTNCSYRTGVYAPRGGAMPPALGQLPHAVAAKCGERFDAACPTSLEGHPAKKRHVTRPSSVLLPDGGAS